jgi:Xaa-Pro aminopeptidase
VCGGYHGDMTRTFTLGRWPAKIREIYEIVLDAQQMAAAALAPGKSTHEIDAVARAHITRHGYGEQFGHGLGHGIGRNGHEDPRLHPLHTNSELEPGQVVTVEPGIYLPGVGGVRIEDDYVITETGARNLCTLPKDLKWATL